VQLGLRGEIASRDFTLLTELPDQPGLPSVDPDSTSLTYRSLFPSAFVVYPMGPGTLVKASYSRRINRPRRFSLNPFPSFEDTLTVNVGNPALRPEYTDAFELTLQYRYFLTLTPFYRRTTDVIRRRTLFDPETGVTTLTFQNLDTQDSYGADLTLAAAAGPARGFLSGSVSRVVTDGGSVETGLASDALSWTLRGNVQLRVREGTDLQFFGFYRAPQEVEDGRISAMGFTTLGFNQRLSDRLSVALRVNDLLSTTRFEFRTGDGETFRLNGVRDPDVQQFSGTLTYTFGRPPQRRPQQQQDPQPQQDEGFGF
jgi:outer membrane receptor protein involved in Fe transport